LLESGVFRQVNDSRFILLELWHLSSHLSRSTLWSFDGFNYYYDSYMNHVTTLFFITVSFQWNRVWFGLDLWRRCGRGWLSWRCRSSFRCGRSCCRFSWSLRLCCCCFLLSLLGFSSLLRLDLSLSRLFKCFCLSFLGLCFSLSLCLSCFSFSFFLCFSRLSLRLCFCLSRLCLSIS
uniref:TLC domain-containing protein n=1 Tax=Haemonchus placei TaxID=6290 RepID=A0A0N4VS85_HAEPC